MDRTTLTLTRAAALARSAWGGALLLDGRTMLSAFGDRPTKSSLIVARVLGARQVAQGAITAVTSSPRVLVAGAVVDVLHATTAVGLALAARRWRSVALTDAAVAATLAGTGWWLAIRAHRRS
ncbi:hypothetical protein ACIA5C_20695 [Actinoplanes sp. NPDC051343]|uniref:hypothetical protein n=1 Tax=Actinoplanes sp. NPDC051343 TaxID=3363906 RepID=UPI0037AD6A1B